MLSIKTIENQLVKLETQKAKAVDMKAKYEAEIETVDSKIKKLSALRKKYEQLENDFTSAINE